MDKAYGIAQQHILDVLSPLMIQSYINWRPQSRTGKKPLKIPIQKIDDPSQHTLIDIAYTKSPRIGLVCNETHQVVALDIDGVSLNHPDIQSLLVKHPTYIENSPSNKDGYHRVLYQLPTPEDKLILKSKGVMKYDEGAIELYSASRNYVTLTGNIHPSSADYVAVLSPQVLTDTFSAFKRSSKVIDHPTATLAHSQRASLPDPEKWTRTVPADEHHPMTQKFLQKHDYIYHDYWLMGIMALHKTFGPMEGLSYAHTWSGLSLDYDPDELEVRWHSLSNEDKYAMITEKTYVWMYTECVIDWPRTNAQGTPIIDEISNTKAFLDYNELSLEIDAVTTTPFMHGPEHAVIPLYYSTQDKKHSMDDNINRLTNIVAFHTREYHYFPKPSTIQNHLEVILARKEPEHYVNRFALWIESQDAYNPNSEKDYLHEFATTIMRRDTKYEYPSQEFHNILVKKWILSIARTFWPQPYHASAEGMLILHGPPKIGKSSLGERLFPKLFRHLHTQVAPNLSGRNMAGMSYKDYKTAVCSKLVVDYDEAEEIFSTNSESAIKTEVTATHDTFRPAYGRHMLSIPRKYSIYASTNESRLQIPHEGDRRYWWLNVEFVDTFLLDEWPIDRMWAQVYYILKQRHHHPPWLLSDQEALYLSHYLTKHRVTTDIEEWLLDFYDWEHGYKILKERSEDEEFGIMKTVSQVLNELKIFDGSYIRIKRTALNRSLRRLCKQHAPTDFKIKKTHIIHGYHERNRQKLFLVPPKRNS